MRHVCRAHSTNCQYGLSSVKRSVMNESRLRSRVGGSLRQPGDQPKRASSASASRSHRSPSSFSDLPTRPMPARGGCVVGRWRALEGAARPASMPSSPWLPRPDAPGRIPPGPGLGPGP